MHLLNIYRWYRQNSALAIARHTGTSTSTSTEHDDRERERNKSAIPIKITQNTSITTIQSVLRARAPARIQQRNILHSNNKFNCKVSSSFSTSIFRHLCTRKLLCIHQAAREEVVDMRKERCIAWFLCVAHLIQIDCSLLALQTQLVRCNLQPVRHQTLKCLDQKDTANGQPSDLRKIRSMYAVEVDYWWKEWMWKRFACNGEKEEERDGHTESMPTYWKWSIVRLRWWVHEKWANTCKSEHLIWIRCVEKLRIRHYTS